MGVTKRAADQTPFVIKKDDAGNVVRTRVSGPAGGELVASIQRTNDGSNYIEARRGLSIFTSSNGQVIASVQRPPFNIVPSPIRVTGTVETLVASFYISSGSYDSAMALLGSELLGNSVTLSVKQFALSSSILVLTGGLGRSSVISTSSVIFPTTDWYDVTILNDVSSGSSLCSGLSFF